MVYKATTQIQQILERQIKQQFALPNVHIASCNLGHQYCIPNLPYKSWSLHLQHNCKSTNQSLLDQQV
jgi:hypothetical protein